MGEHKSESVMGVGIVGTGYAAKRRAEAIQGDRRSHLVTVSGYSRENTEAFCQEYQIQAAPSWQALVEHPQLDLVIIATVNQDHAPIAQKALEAGKHVVLEYPLALSPQDGQTLLALAEQQGKLLHVEHIELLGGVHQALRQSLGQIGEVSYGRYITITPQRPVSRRWTYHKSLFGFPFTAALSRLHRLTNIWGEVASVRGTLRYWDVPESEYFRACLATAQLEFRNGAIADLVYGKGETFWQSTRTLELHGEQGTLVFAGETGKLIQGEQETPLEVSRRRGLFQQDTQLVLDYLLDQKPLYVHARQSYYALLVADAIRHSVETGEKVTLAPC
ncbi:Gfo/Idh/MocA family protein [Spirulina subsalsa]|uniref:Gfo/Idh/MocA family protein n=1 Tax=Spirulina subsalsa TaxID=54311 RepID=UPI000525A93D|nr:Gfo/Idh/MocA family oxidoreductase [Spirulina subsalsa]